MTLNAALLRENFEMVLGRRPDLTHRFYEVLFARHPEVRALFGRNSGPRQERMLADALVAVMDHLEDAPWLDQQLGAMGEKHAGYGVTPGMFAWVGDALLATLAEASGLDWSAALEQAWSAAFQAIVTRMLAGYPAAIPVPA